MSSGKLGQSPWGAILARPGGDDGSDGPEPGTVITEDPITGDGSSTHPVGLDLTVEDPITGAGTAGDPLALALAVQSPITGDGSSGSPIAVPNATETSAGLMGVADKNFIDHLQADWDITLCRYYLVDYDGGNDGNVGFIDAAPGSTLAPAGLALKTIDRLFFLLPRLGNGRMVKALIKNRAAGATYVNSNGVTPSDLSTAGLSGYSILHICGSSDLTNSAADQIAAGAIQGAVGPGTNGVWTATAGATTTSLTVASGVIPAEPGVIGMRVRFTGNVTPALANVCNNISASTSSTLTFGGTNTAPANGDTFTIEIPGVRLNTVNLRYAGFPTATGAGGVPVSIVGLAAVNDQSATFNVCAPNVFVGFCESLPATSSLGHAVFSDGFLVQSTSAYRNEAGALADVGMGFRARGRMSVTDCHTVSFLKLAGTLAGAAGPGLQRCLFGTWAGQGSYFGSPASVNNCGMVGATGSPALQVGGGRAVAANAKLRAVGSLAFLNYTGAIAGIDVASAGATGAINMATATTGSYITIDNVSGSTGNTGVGLDLVGCQSSTVALGSTTNNTVTGTTGDVRLAGNVVTTHAVFTSVSIADTGNNVVSGTGGILQKDRCFVFTNGDGTAHAIGEIVRVVTGTPTTVVRAQADTNPNASGALFCAVTTPAAAAAGYYLPLSAAAKRLLFSAAAAVNGIAYLHPTVAGAATTTIPTIAVQQKRRLGISLSAGALATAVVGSVDNISVISDGLP